MPTGGAGGHAFFLATYIVSDLDGWYAISFQHFAVFGFSGLGRFSTGRGLDKGFGDARGRVTEASIPGPQMRGTGGTRPWGHSG